MKSVNIRVTPSIAVYTNQCFTNELKAPNYFIQKSKTRKITRQYENITDMKSKPNGSVELNFINREYLVIFEDHI